MLDDHHLAAYSPIQLDAVGARRTRPSFYSPDPTGDEDYPLPSYQG